MARSGRVRSHARIAVLTVVVALIGALGVPLATAATDKPTVTGPGTGPQPKGQGLGSSAALAQETCAPNGHTTLNYEGSGPFCVNPWPEGKNNGGATAPGVTATEVKVVAYIPNDSMDVGSSKPTNRATGAMAELPDTITDFQKIYDYGQEQFVDVPAVGAHTEDRDRHRERRRRDGAARRRARGHQHEAVHGRRPDRYVDRRRAGVRLGGRGEEDHRLQLVDDCVDRRAAEPVPLELRRRQRRRLSPHRGVRGQVVGGREGPVGGRRRR